MAPLQRSKSAIQSDQLQIQHFIHPHLINKLFNTSEFNCDGCNTGGYGVRYQCSACDFDLHEQCATAPHRISANIHPHHQLILVNRPGGDSHFCHVCKGITNGLSYTCEVQTCEFNVHTVCVVAKTAGDKSLTLGTTSSSIGGGYNGVISNNNNQPAVVINHHQQLHGTPMTVLGVVNNSQPVPTMVNHHLPQQQMQGMHTMQFGGFNGANTTSQVPMMVNQTHMINHHIQQQQQQVNPTAGYGGYNGANNSHMMVNNHHHQQKQGNIQTTPFGVGMNNINNQTQMINNHQLQQQQVIPFGGYNGGMNSQPMMVNHHQQQQQLMPTTSFNSNQQFMTNVHNQQLHQQQQGIPQTAVGGYNVVNNNQTVMIQQPPPLQPQQQQSNGYTKVGKIAANILSTSLIGIPLFNSRN